MNDETKSVSGKNEQAVKFIGIILIGIGLLFLIHSIIPGLSMAYLWPLFLLIPVCILLSVLVSKGKAASGVIIPIVILTTLAVYFLIMNYAGWHYWSRQTWPVFLLAPALGFYAFYLMSGEKGILIPAGILTVLAVIFFGAIFDSVNLVGICFIAAGAIILVSTFIKRRK